MLPYYKGPCFSAEKLDNFCVCVKREHRLLARLFLEFVSAAAASSDPEMMCYKNKKEFERGGKEGNESFNTEK